MKPTKQPTSRAQLIIDKYLIEEKGSTTIAKELGIHENSILKVLKQHNVPRRQIGREKTSESKIREMEKMYNEGYSLEAVGEHFGSGAARVLGYFKRLDIPRRSAEEAHRIYAINEDFFDNIDTEEKAYFLGFLFADGCNQIEHFYAIVLGLNEQDKEILYKFSSLIYKDPNIAFDQVKFIDRTHEDKGITANLSINSKHMCIQAAKLGLLTRKTFLLTWPKWLDRKLHRHFFRGYFDGDGTINNEKEKSSGCKIISTKEFIEGARMITPVPGTMYKNDDSEEAEDKNTWILSFNGNRNIQKMLNWMYDGSTIYLKRKYDKHIVFNEKMVEIDRKTFAGTQGYSLSNLYKNYPDYHAPLNINGIELTTKNIGNMSMEERAYIAHDIFSYFRIVGFNFTFDKKKLLEGFDVLRDFDTSNELKSNSRLCTTLCKLYCKDLYYNARYIKNYTIREAFMDDDLLMKCIENRLGLTRKTDELFMISFANIIQGFISSGITYNVSIFKPTIAKYVYEKYSDAGDIVYDYSAGWGTRMLGAASCGRKYIGVDPLTTNSLKNLRDDLNLNDITLINDGSENVRLEKGSIDFAFSSPPYFNLEQYSNEETQAYSKGEDYFYDVYWRKTLENVKYMLKPGKWFGVNIVNLPRMLDITKKYFGEIENRVEFSMPRSHFSKQGQGTKSEYIYMFKNV